MASQAAQFDLLDPPKDGISKVRFANKSNNLSVSSWDATLRLYNVHDRKIKQKWTLRGAVLDCAFSQDDLYIASGGLARQFTLHNVEAGTMRTCGSHLGPISCIEYNEHSNQFVSGSWDTVLSLWDHRSKEAKIATTSCGKKVFAMTCANHHVIVGTADRKVFIYDIRNLARPLQDRESNLKHQTRDIQSNNTKDGFLLTSVEGRVAVEYINLSKEWQDKKFAFKCHRHTDKETQSQTVYPVNCASYHPIYGTFVTGGCDGLVNVWDGANKKRICQFPQFATSIASVDFNRDGRMLAIGVSYTWEQGEKPDVPPDQICIRNVRESEIQPKKKSRI